jgi:drug/metabolite transporter (DMT)-like permease
MMGASMRLFLWTGVAMLAFAGNSVFTRWGVGQLGMDAVVFSVIRLAAGAVTLAGLVVLRQGAWWPGWQGRAAGVFGLLLYLFGFSLAYVELATGVGALILFGMVQVTMFGGAVLAREAVPGRRWAGAVLAFGGLVWHVSPFGQAVALGPAACMGAAGFGWGVYSLAGRGARDPVLATAANFCLALPVAGLALLWHFDAAGVSAAGVGVAVLSGAVTSGLGYALWYGVVPHLGAARAGVAQLSVPILAAVAGVVWLGEALDLRFAIAAGIVLGGVGLASFGGKRRGG